METQISGYASLFWTRDLNDDVTAAGAFGDSLAKTGAGGVRMLCQHDADRPVGVWDEVVEDGRGGLGRLGRGGTGALVVAETDPPLRHPSPP